MSQTDNRNSRDSLQWFMHLSLKKLMLFTELIPGLEELLI